MVVYLSPNFSFKLATGEKEGKKKKSKHLSNQYLLQ